jgi:hypothetical protein
MHGVQNPHMKMIEERVSKFLPWWSRCTASAPGRQRLSGQFLEAAGLFRQRANAFGHALFFLQT